MPVFYGGLLGGSELGFVEFARSSAPAAARLGASLKSGIAGVVIGSSLGGVAGWTFDSVANAAPVGVSELNRKPAVLNAPVVEDPAPGSVESTVLE